MNFAIGTFVTDETVDPGTLARLVEERGFEALLFAEHTHIPASRETPYPAGGDLPREYSHTYDPFVALTVAALATDRLFIGTGICLVIQHDPIVIAKAVASVDRVSHGRFLFGVGAGWNVEEMRHHGTEPGRRFGLLQERVEAIRTIWTHDEATYHGDHVNFDRIWSWPKPVQEPGPAVLVGGNGPGVIDRVLAFGDEWFPNRVGDDEKLQSRVRRLRDAGKPTTLANAPREPEILEAYHSAGVERALWWMPPGDAADAERRLDRLAAVVAEYNGRR